MTDSLILDVALVPKEIEHFNVIVRNLVEEQDPEKLPDVDAIAVSYPTALHSEDVTCTRAIIALDIAHAVFNTQVFILSEDKKLAVKFKKHRFPENPHQFADLVADVEGLRKRIKYMRQSRPETQVLEQLVDEFSKCCAFAAVAINNAKDKDIAAVAVTKVATHAVATVKICALTEAAMRGWDTKEYAKNQMLAAALMILREWVTAGHQPQEDAEAVYRATAASRARVNAAVMGG